MSSSQGNSSGGLQAGPRLLGFALAGLIGGALGTKLSELPGDPDPNTYFDLDSYESALRVSSGVQFMLVMATIGVALTLANYLIEKSSMSAEQLVRVVLALVVLGFASGFIAQSVYASLLRDCAASCDGQIRVARTVGWGIAGLLGGIGIGLGYASKKRFQNATLGGLIGGVVGGFLFDPIANAVEGDGASSRLVATCLIGLLIGLLIAVAETVRATVWLEIVSGEARGRQYIVFDDETRVGSARGVGITLVGDRSIGEHHLTIRQSANSVTFECAPGRSVLHRGVDASHGALSSGDVVRIGATDVAVQFKKGDTMPSYPQPLGAAGVAGSPQRTPAGLGRPNASPVSNAPARSSPPPPPPVSDAARQPSPSSPSWPSSRPTLPTRPQ